MEKVKNNPYAKLLETPVSINNDLLNQPKVEDVKIKGKRGDSKKTGRPGRYTNAAKDSIPELDIDRKINAIARKIESEHFVSLTYFSEISNISYPIVHKWATDTNGLPHKKDPGPNNTTRWVGPGEEVGKWLREFGRKAIAVSILRDRERLM